MAANILLVGSSESRPKVFKRPEQDINAPEDDLYNSIDAGWPEGEVPGSMSPATSGVDAGYAFYLCSQP